METLGHHVILRLGDDRVIAPAPNVRRAWARRLGELVEAFPILAWKLADTHLHILVLGDGAVVAEIVRRLRIWVTKAMRPGVPLEVQRTKPIAGQSHLAATFRYVLAQDAHHGVATDAWQEGSSVVDILGMRVLAPALPLRAREHLPRLAREDLLVHLGVTTLEETVHAEHLAEAARAAFALDKLGLDAASARARRAAVAAGNALGPSRLAEALGITPQAVCRLARSGVPARDARAVRLQMALRAAKPPVDGFG